MLDKRIVLVGHFGGGGEAVRKEEFVKTLAERAQKAKVKLLIIENSGANAGLEIDSSEHIFCVEYACRFPFDLKACFLGVLSILSGFLISFHDTVELLSRECLYAKDYTRSTWIKRFARVVSGWGRMKAVIHGISLSSNDILVTWGEVPTLHQLLRKEADKVHAGQVIAEYGELQACFFLSEAGLFADAWPTTQKPKFQKLELSRKNKETAKLLRCSSRENKISNKQYSDELGDLSSWICQRKVIFVPGLYSLGAGVAPSWSTLARRNSPFFADNLDLLRAVARVAERHGWVVLYKDHPNTSSYTPNRQILEPPSKNVRILGNVDIYDVLEASNIMVSLASKSVFLALFCEIPVVLAAPFTISGHDLAFELASDEELESKIVDAMDSDVDIQRLDDFNGRLMQYYLYSLNAGESYFERGPIDAADDLISFVKGERKHVSIG